jgi:hypothetical protein
MLLIADWQAIVCTHEHHVYENLRRANRKQHQYDYAPGQQVLKKMHDPTKLVVRTEGPYTIERVHVNGNCRKPPRHVPYKRTYVRYNDTFCASN